MFHRRKLHLVAIADACIVGSQLCQCLAVGEQKMLGDPWAWVSIVLSAIDLLPCLLVIWLADIKMSLSPPQDDVALNKTP
jgi:hypothetical protein